jgi:putative transposase
MGSVGDCFDNAMCESFFATLECELLDRSRFETQAEACGGIILRLLLSPSEHFA